MKAPVTRRRAGRPRTHDIRIDIRIDDGPCTPTTGGGFCLVGTGEHVAPFDGKPKAGPRPDGGFRVHATPPAATNG